MCCASFPLFFVTCQNTPRLRQNFDIVTTARGAHYGIRKTAQHDTFECCTCHEKLFCACHAKSNTPLRTMRTYYLWRVPHKTMFAALWKTMCYACHGKRKQTTVETFNTNHFAQLALRKATFTLTTVARKRLPQLRTVADGCGHQGCVEQYVSTPRPGK